MIIITPHIPAGFPAPVHLAIQAVNGDESTDILLQNELEEYRLFGSPGRRREYLSTRSLLAGLRGELGLDSSQFSLHKNEMGKPVARYGGERIHVSFAHSHNTTLCALSMQDDLGVDLEPAERELGEGLGDRIRHPGEKDLFKGDQLVRLWTLKEAAVKLDGRGLRMNLNEICVKPVAEHLYTVTLRDDKSARICSFRYNEYWIALACYQT